MLPEIKTRESFELELEGIARRLLYDEEGELRASTLDVAFEALNGDKKAMKGLQAFVEGIEGVVSKLENHELKASSNAWSNTNNCFAAAILLLIEEERRERERSALEIQRSLAHEGPRFR